MIQTLKNETSFPYTGIGGVSLVVSCITNEHHDASGSTAKEGWNGMNQTEERKDEHGHEKLVEIIINTRPHTVEKEQICFAEVVKLSGLPGGPNVTFTVTYRRGPSGHHEGSLVEGKCVPVKDGMIFNVTATDKS